MKIKTIIPSLFIVALAVALLIVSNGFANVNAQGINTNGPNNNIMVVESRLHNQSMKQEQWHYHQL